MQADFNKLSATIDKLEYAAIELMRKLIAINSVGPRNNGPGEMEKADFLKNYLRQAGFFNITDYPAGDASVASGQRPNFSAELPGRQNRTTLWIIVHTDIVPPGELTKWQTDPYQALIRDGKIYGRGSEDNHQGIVSAITAAQAFPASGIEPACNLRLLFVADEETGSTHGLVHMIEHHPALFKKDDLIIIPDAGEADSRLIEVAEKSILWLKFKTIGKQVHASTPEQGNNAFRAASHLVVELDSLHELFPAREEVFSPAISTFEPTRKEANVPNINTIPGEDIFYLDCRILPAYAIADIMNAIGRIMAGIEKKFQVRIEMSVEQGEQAAPPTAATAPVVILLKSAIREVYGQDARARGIGGGTVAAILRRKGFPVAVWSTMDEVGHQPDEYCIIANMMNDAKVFAWCALTGGEKL
jgi:succinyl-diaminopimelate desuccinylase